MTKCIKDELFTHRIGRVFTLNEETLFKFSLDTESFIIARPTSVERLYFNVIRFIFDYIVDGECSVSNVILRDDKDLNIDNTDLGGIRNLVNNDPFNFICSVVLPDYYSNLLRQLNGT